MTAIPLNYIYLTLGNLCIIVDSESNKVVSVIPPTELVQKTATKTVFGRHNSNRAFNRFIDSVQRCPALVFLYIDDVLDASDITQHLP